MSRVEENMTVIKQMNKYIESCGLKTEDCVLTVLVDISESLAAIADALERRAEDDNCTNGDSCH